MWDKAEIMPAACKNDTSEVAVLQAAGEHIGALAMSEPGAGSDVVGMRCRADYREGKFVLNGTKMWCTNGVMASTLVVYAKTQPEKGPHGITAFLIEKGMKVLQRYPTPDRHRCVSYSYDCLCPANVCKSGLT